MIDQKSQTEFRNARHDLIIEVIFDYVTTGIVPLTQNELAQIIEEKTGKSVDRSTISKDFRDPNLIKRMDEIFKPHKAEARVYAISHILKAVKDGDMKVIFRLKEIFPDFFSTISEDPSDPKRYASFPDELTPDEQKKFIDSVNELRKISNGTNGSSN